MPERRGFARRGTASSSLSSFLRLSLFYLSVSAALPCVNSLVTSRARLHVYLMRVHAEIFACAHVSKTYRGRRRERKAVAARMHARMRSEPRWFRLFARTHARNDARGSSFLRATDAPIRARVSFVIRENVNQSLLAAARSSGPNLPRGSAFLFVFQSRAFWTRPHAICRVRCG